MTLNPFLMTLYATQYIDWHEFWLFDDQRGNIIMVIIGSFCRRIETIYSLFQMKAEAMCMMHCVHAGASALKLDNLISSVTLLPSASSSLEHTPRTANHKSIDLFRLTNRTRNRYHTADCHWANTVAAVAVAVTNKQSQRQARSASNEEMQSKRQQHTNDESVI